jgi:hypothetical protein
MSRKSRVLVVGTVTTVLLLGAAAVGAVATFEDVAIWGDKGGHSVDTPARARPVDLQLAVAGLAGCGTFSNDLTTPVLSGTATEGAGQGLYICLQNTGGSANQPITVKASATDVSDIDTDCTGQEADFDTTCGNDGAGEASPVLNLFYAELDCSTLTVKTDFTCLPFSQPINDVTIINNEAAGTPRCFDFGFYHGFAPDEIAEQAGQSDTLSFTIKFKGQYTTGGA